MRTLEEQETAIVQSAADRRRGVWLVYSDDPYWIRRLDQRAKKLRTDGPGAWYELEHRQITIRKPRSMLKSRASGQSEGQTGPVFAQPLEEVA